MTQKYIYIIGLMALLFCSCTPRRITTTTERTDSVRVVKEVEYIERWRTDTVLIEVPTESKEAIRQDSSHLETSFATSDAKILPNGSLLHSLANKQQIIEREIEIKDTEEKTTEKEIIIQRERIEVPIPYPLKRWQKLLIWCGAVAIGLLTTLLLKKIFWR